MEYTRFTSLLATVGRTAMAGIGLLIVVMAAPGMPAAAQKKPTGTSDGARTFYMTTTLHDGSQAASACAAGFHMASLWEILDVSNLKYDTTLGYVREDSGFGPPGGRSGWIRTGAIPREDATVGLANCLAWTSNDPLHSGTKVALGVSWSALTPPSPISPWTASVWACDATWPVWCVQD